MTKNTLSISPLRQRMLEDMTDAQARAEQTQIGLHPCG